VPCATAGGAAGEGDDPLAGFAQPAVGALDFSSDSSIGSESRDAVEVARLAP
jgi:hypothetical protein